MIFPIFCKDYEACAIIRFVIIYVVSEKRLASFEITETIFFSLHDNFFSLNWFYIVFLIEFNPSLHWVIKEKTEFLIISVALFVR